MAKKRAPSKKQQKQKVFVAVGGLLLLIVFVYEAKMLGLIGGKSAPAEAVPAVTTPATGTAPPNSLTPPAIPGATSTAPVTAQLADTDLPAASASGELVSFGVFETKNPFAPQVTEQQSSAVPTAPAPAAAGVAAAAPAEPVRSTVPTPAGAIAAPAQATTAVPKAVATAAPAQATAVPAPSDTAPTSSAATTTAAEGTNVTISVNGRSERVGRDGTFPRGAPVFRLVSFQHGQARIGIVGGSYESGDATLTLAQGEPVTLMNTSDRKQYKLVLLSTP